MGKNILARIKKAVALSLVAVTAIVCLSCGFWEDNSISDGQYYTGEQIEAVFHSNEAQFTEVAKIVLESDAFIEKIEYGGEASARVMWKTDSQYFTEEQWQKITDFFQIIGPADITRYDAVKYGYMRGMQYIIGIHFPQNNKGQRVALYYIDMPDEIEISKNRAQFYDAFKKTGEHWWLGKELDGIPLNGLLYQYSYYENGEWHRKEEMQEGTGS